jgi:hypothetical protein
MAIEIIRVETKEVVTESLGLGWDGINHVSTERNDVEKFVIAMNGRPLIQFDDYDSAEATARHLYDIWRNGGRCTETLLSLDTTKPVGTGPTNL